MIKQIETYIGENLSGESKRTALELVEFLRDNELTFYKDTCDCWKDKIYYWVKLGDACVCFIAIKDPDEPDNLWTIWSDDSSAYEDASISEEIKNVGWQFIDHCGNCGSCGGGKTKVIFGKSFQRVCGCTFRIDNATQRDLPFLKTMVDLRIRDLQTNDVASHYDLLVDENNDPVHDPEPLREYMDKWDGQVFLSAMELDETKTVLEIGVGTGRLAIKTAPLCKYLLGVDLSPKTIERAKQNLAQHPNAELKCADFMTYGFDTTFDVIYSSLTFLHIREKQKCMDKISSLLKPDGRLVLSIDKSKSVYIDYGSRRIRVYPDNPTDIRAYIEKAKLAVSECIETEFAYIFVCTKA